MNLRRFAALALVLLALLSAAPLLVPVETDALPGFDDTDESDGAAAPVLLLASPAFLPAAAPRFEPPSDWISHQRSVDNPVSDEAASGPLVSRAPPRS